MSISNTSDQFGFFGVAPKHRLMLIVIFFFVLALDQASKLWVVSVFERGHLLPVVDGVFNLTLTFNKGAAFGVFSSLPDGTRQILLAITTIIALSAVLFFLAKDYRGHLLAQVALTFILAGAVGNVLDRFRQGEVIDFLDFYWGSYHWPAFNIADSFICIGVGLLLLISTKKSKIAPKS